MIALGLCKPFQVLAGKRGYDLTTKKYFCFVNNLFDGFCCNSIRTIMVLKYFQGLEFCDLSFLILQRSVLNTFMSPKSFQAFDDLRFFPQFPKMHLV